jgi:hypothetical protein
MNNFSAHIDKIHGKLIFPSNINNYLVSLFSCIQQDCLTTVFLMFSSGQKIKREKGVFLVY